jgi:hypothetical protein
LLLKKIHLITGSYTFPYYLHFSAYAIGDSSYSGLGIVFTLPSHEPYFGHSSKYIGEEYNIHIARYKALIAGLKAATLYGIKYNVACREAKLIEREVFNN